METDTDLPAGATDRRTALKRAAAAAGVVAWTTPAVQVLSGGTAHAATVTGCRPMATVTLRETGEGSKNGFCECVLQLKAACCSSNTSFPVVTATCGDTCGGEGTVNGMITITPTPVFKCDEPPAVSVELNCSSIPTNIVVTVPVKCADGITTDVKVTADDITCIKCPPALAATAIVPEADVSTLDPTTTTTTTATGEPAPSPTEPSTTSTEPATTTSTEPATTTSTEPPTP